MEPQDDSVWGVVFVQVNYFLLTLALFFARRKRPDTAIVGLSQLRRLDQQQAQIQALTQRMSQLHPIQPAVQESPVSMTTEEALETLFPAGKLESPHGDFRYRYD